MNDRDLMVIRADTVFTYDARRRMLRTNEPHEASRRPAPRLFLGRTLDGQVVRFGTAVPDALARRLEEVIERHPPYGDVRIPLSALAAVREELARHAPITTEAGGPAYQFPESVAVPGEVVRMTDANVELARDTYPWLLNELAAWQPCLAVVRDGAAVSVCFSARIGTEVAEAGVETLPDFRGRGYATAVTAAWGAAIRASRRIPLYSTSWDNLASQGVARRLGLILYGTDATWE